MNMNSGQYPLYRRVLITRMKFIGDVILTTPIINSVRAALPSAYIAYMGEKGAVSLLEHNPTLDEIIPFDFSVPSIIEQTRVGLLLRRRRFDLVIDLFGNPRSALLTYLSGAHTRVGIDRPGRGKLYTIHIQDDKKPKTAIGFHEQFLQVLGIPSATTRTEITLTEEERRTAARLLASLEERAPVGDVHPPVIGLHVGATWPAKMWLPERFGELAAMICSKLGAQVILTAGPKDADVLGRVKAVAGASAVAVPVLPLRELAAAISLCSVFVSNDAGPMHIAPAVGIPTIGLFGPGEEEIWFPYSRAEGHLALRMEVPCHPCHLDVCNRAGEQYMECMKLLTVEDVFEVVKASLRR
jgi:lipopolysaccharide heptosyltransferase II